ALSRSARGAEGQRGGGPAGGAVGGGARNLRRARGRAPIENGGGYVALRQARRGDEGARGPIGRTARAAAAHRRLGEEGRCATRDAEDDQTAASGGRVRSGAGGWGGGGDCRVDEE